MDTAAQHIFWRFSRWAFVAFATLAALLLASLLLPTSEPPAVGCYWRVFNDWEQLLPSYQCHGFAGSGAIENVMNSVLFIGVFMPVTFIGTLVVEGVAGLGNFSIWMSVSGLAIIAIVLIALLTPVRWATAHLRRQRAAS